MLAKKNRFHRRNQVNYVHRKGTMVRSPNISVKYVEGQKHKDYRVAVMVSRKVTKSAVKRNRIRRRIYSIVENLDPPLRNDIDLVVMVFDEDVAECDFSSLVSMLEQLIDKNGLRSS